jgi:putative nucleotidyltransferase with HDIG domain
MEELKKVFADIIDHGKAIEPDTLLENVAQLFRARNTITELFDMLNNMRTVDDSVYAHNLNVALISRMIGRWLHLDAGDLNTLTLAGLLHDIGKAMIPEEILNKPGSLTDEEFELIKSHTRLGYDVLKYQDIDLRIKNAALMHHERSDGSGYPSHLTDEDIDDFAKIIAIADVYDAMTAARSYRAPLCAFQVISNFERDGYQKYHTKYLLTFLKRIATTYQSNRVVLSDGRGCKIVMLNQNDLSRPIVQFDDKSCLDLSTNRDLFITAII